MSYWKHKLDIKLDKMRKSKRYFNLEDFEKNGLAGIHRFDVIADGSLAGVVSGNNPDVKELNPNLTGQETGFQRQQVRFG